MSDFLGGLRIAARKTVSFWKEASWLIRQEKAFFLAPLLIMLLLLAIFVVYFGQSALMTFIYAGL
jgi:hypothetical protein